MYPQSSVCAMACSLLGAKPQHEPVMAYCHPDQPRTALTCRLQCGGHYVPASVPRNDRNSKQGSFCLCLTHEQNDPWANIPKLVMHVSHHDDVMTWKRLPHYRPFARRSTSRKGPVMGALLFTSMLVWTNCWTTVGLAIIWDAMKFIWRYCNYVFAVTSSPPSAAYMRQWIGTALVQIMVCRLFGAKPSSKPILAYSQLDHKAHILVKC